MSRFATSVGVELTFSRNDRAEREHYIHNMNGCWYTMDNYDYGTIKNSIVKSFQKKITTDIPLKQKRIYTTLISNACTDSSVEIPTPIMRSKSDASLVWDIVLDSVKKTKKLQCKQRQTSGGHIHLGLGSLYKKDLLLYNKFMLNTFIWFVNRPWFSWAFNDPNDTSNSNTYQYNYNGLFEGNFDFEYNYKKFISDLNVQPNRNTMVCDSDMYNHISRRHPASFRLLGDKDVKTVEFRLFEMPINKDRYMQHIEVALALYKTFEENKLVEFQDGSFNKLKYRTSKKISAIKLETALTEFENDLISLGFNPEDFEYAFINIVDKYKITKASHSTLF